MNAPIHILSLVFCAVISLGAATQPFSFPRSTPEAQGVSPKAVLEFVQALDQIDALNSVLIARHGKVVAEGWWAPYNAPSRHELYSLSKSFTSTAVGFAVAEGRLSIDDEVLKFFPDEAPPNPGANLKAMRVRDLLTMSCGHQDEVPSAPDKISVKAFLTNAVPHKPGTHFKYNTPATFMCSAIVQKLTDQTVLDYLTPRLFQPLGITGPTWNTNWQGISLGGYGLNLRTEDIARFGQLYLQKGRWQGKQLIPKGWVELATSKQVSNGSNPKSDWDQGYGFQFWRCRNGAYRGDGAFGQYCLVLPDQDAVIAITSGLKDMQGVLNLVWEKLLPGFRHKPMRAMGEGKQLKETLASLTVRPAEGSPSPGAAAKVFGRKFVFPKNAQNLDSLTFASNDNGKETVVSIQAGGTTYSFTAGYREWKKGPGTGGDYTVTNAPAAATSAWAAEDTLVVKQCLTETPYYVTHTFRFDGDQVYYDLQRNVGFGATKQPQLVGRVD